MQCCELTVETQSPLVVEFLKAIAELGPEHQGEGCDREEITRRDPSPALAVAGEAAAGDDAVQMIVRAQALAPGVQHGGDANLSAEALVAKGQQRGAGRGEEQVVERPAVLGDEGIEGMGQGKDDVEIGRRQQIGLLLLLPLDCLALLAARRVAAERRRLAARQTATQEQPWSEAQG